MSGKEFDDLLLTSYEWAAIAAEPTGNGGFQQFIRDCQQRAEMLADGVAVSFTRAQLGDLVFYMAYGWDKGRGGYQGKLRRAFGRALLERLGLK